jgi:hypothetical protein
MDMPNNAGVFEVERAGWISKGWARNS